MDAKKLLIVLVIVFVGFWLFTDPNGLAHAATSSAETAWSLITRFFRSLINFLSAL